MTAQQMYEALPTLEKLSKEAGMPMKKAYQVYLLLIEVNKQKEFFIEKQKELIQNHNAEVGEDGRIKFSNQEDLISFSQKYEELMSCEVAELPHVELTFDDFGDIKISPSEIMSLSEIITIKEN